jgi:HlyD family secretion protein
LVSKIPFTFLLRAQIALDFVIDDLAELTSETKILVNPTPEYASADSTFQTLGFLSYIPRYAAWPLSRRSGIEEQETPTETPMSPLAISRPSRKLPTLLIAGLLCLAALPALAADTPDPDAPKGPSVTVLTAAKSCFSNIVEVSGIVLAREETAVRPERQGLKVAEVLADAGDTVTAGQTLARLNLPEGGTALVQAPVAGLISSSTAVIGATASSRGEALFNIIARSEFDVVGLVPTQNVLKLAVNQPASISIPGAGTVDGKVRRIAPTIEPNSQLGQVFIAVTTNRRLLVNSSGRALIKTGQSCGVAVPLTAVLYGTGGTVVQVVRRSRVETKRVEVGLMAGGQVEIREGLAEGDVVVARAGSLLREGDPVRPVTASADK